MKTSIRILVPVYITHRHHNSLNWQRWFEYSKYNSIPPLQRISRNPSCALPFRKVTVLSRCLCRVGHRDCRQDLHRALLLDYRDCLEVLSYRAGVWAWAQQASGTCGICRALLGLSIGGQRWCLRTKKEQMRSKSLFLLYYSWKAVCSFYASFKQH